MVTDEEYDTELHVHSGFFDDIFQYLQIRECDFDKRKIYEKCQRRFKATYE